MDKRYRSDRGSIDGSYCLKVRPLTEYQRPWKSKSEITMYEDRTINIMPSRWELVNYFAAFVGLLRTVVLLENDLIGPAETYTVLVTCIVLMINGYIGGGYENRI